MSRNPKSPNGCTPIGCPPGAAPDDVVMINGVRCEVVTPEAAEEAEVVVCVGITLPLLHADNLTGDCVECGDELQFRPHAPKKPPKICMACLNIRMVRQEMADLKKQAS